MPEPATPTTIDAAGMPTGVLDAGAGHRAIVLLHGGIPGRALYAPTTELWRPLIARLTAPRVLAIDLPGTGGSAISDAEDLTVAATIARVEATLEVAGVTEAIVVGHGDASVIAMELALSRPMVKGAAILAGLGTAPTGDGTPPIALRSPITPLWSAASQRWTMTRLSYNHSHITGELLDQLVAAAAGPAHHAAVELMRQPSLAAAATADWMAAKVRFFAACREPGYAVPISIVWAANDPLLSISHGDVLFDILSTTRAELDFALIPRAGHLLHRDQPHAVARQLNRLVHLTL